MQNAKGNKKIMNKKMKWLKEDIKTILNAKEATKSELLKEIKSDLNFWMVETGMNEKELLTFIKIEMALNHLK